MLDLALNLLIVVLLAVTIAYCWLLNRRIKVLQDSKSELAQLLGHFDESTQRASESIIALQTASKKIGENIQFRIDKANYLLDDLAFMIERGNKLANQMEAGFAVSRARSRVATEPPAEAEPEPPPIMERPPTVREKTSASLDAVLERVATRNKPEVSEEAKPERQAMPERPPAERKSGRVRSKAEQELLDLIKAGIKG